MHTESQYRFTIPHWQGRLAKINIRLRQKCVKLTDQRTRLMNEVLNCIKLIKMYAWEDIFSSNLSSKWKTISLIAYVCFVLGVCLVELFNVGRTHTFTLHVMSTPATRQQKRTYLQRAGYLGSYTLGLVLSACPAVLIAAVVGNRLLGNDITAAQVSIKCF